MCLQERWVNIPGIKGIAPGDCWREKFVTRDKKSHQFLLQNPRALPSPAVLQWPNQSPSEIADDNDGATGQKRRSWIYCSPCWRWTHCSMCLWLLGTPDHTWSVVGCATFSQLVLAVAFGCSQSSPLFYFLTLMFRFMAFLNPTGVKTKINAPWLIMYRHLNHSISGMLRSKGMFWFPLLQFWPLDVRVLSAFSFTPAEMHPIILKP